MKAVLITVLLLAACFAARTSSSKVTQKRVNDLQATKLGRTFFNFVTLHAAVQGPIQELLEAIQELIDDLNNDLQELEFNFQRRTNEHNAYVVELEQDIGDAETDIARTDDAIQNLLIPRRNQIQNRIDQIQDNMAFNRKTLQEETLVRQQDHEAYEFAVAEYNEAIAAVDECLGLMESLVGGEGASLIQVKKVQNAMNKLSKKTLNKSQNGPMLQALISLATSANFADGNIIRQIIEKFNEFRNECVDAINELTSQEADAVVAYEQRVQQLDLEYAEFQAAVNDATVDLTATVEKIEEMNTFLNSRELDRQQYVAQLELENETYAQETEIYQNIKEELLRELAVSEQAFSLVNSADFGSSVDFGKF